MNNKSYLTILVILAIIFGFVYCWFGGEMNDFATANDGQRIFSWPDAMANNFFVGEYIEKTDFVKDEVMNEKLQNAIHPRSTNVVNSNIVPMSFLGMLIVFGWIGKLTTAGAVMYLTPILSSVAVLFFYGIVRRVFNKKIGFISAVLLFTLSAFVYYANLSMLHTGLFLFLIMGAVYFYIRQSDFVNGKAQLKFSMLCGLFFGLALITRSIEYFWIGIIVVLPLLFYFRKVKWQQVVSFLIFVMIPFGILGYYNYQIYGEIFTLGYFQMGESADLLNRVPSEFAITEGDSVVKNYVKLFFAPFGFSLKNIVVNFSNYLVNFLWPYVLLFSAGAVLVIDQIRRHKFQKKVLVYFLISFLVSVYLILYYGSWEFIDPLVLKNNIIGSSYIRYWLPIYILMLPVVGFFLFKVNSVKANKYLRYSLIGAILIYLSLFSFNQVYLTKGDGLFAQRAVIEGYYDTASRVNEIIEDDAIVVTNRHDKLFWPERQVIMFNLDYSVFERIANAGVESPFYYFSIMPDCDIEYMNKQIEEYGIEIVEPSVIRDEMRLFSIKY
jgi:hypothetical protein